MLGGVTASKKASMDLLRRIAFPRNKFSGEIDERIEAEVPTKTGLT
jgi:hypothetical protein